MAAFARATSAEMAASIFNMELMDDEIAPEPLTYRAFRAREALLAWEERRRAHEACRSVGHAQTERRMSLKRVRMAFARLSHEVLRSV
jgi:hypothetical protein